MHSYAGCAVTSQYGPISVLSPVVSVIYITYAARKPLELI